MKKIILLTGLIVFCASGGFLWLNLPYRYLFESHAYFNSGKIAKAVALLKEGTNKYPDNSSISFLLAKAYLSLGDTGQASNFVLKKELIKSLKNNKDFQDFLVDLSESNQKQGNERLSRYFGDQYLELVDEKETTARLVKNYIRLGQSLPHVSVEILEKAFNIADALKDTELKESIKGVLLPKYFQTVESLKLGKKYEEAQSVLDKASILGKNAEVNFQKAILYNEAGKVELAQSYFEEALQLEDSNNEYKITYANALEMAAQNTNDNVKRKEYHEKIKLLLASTEDSSRKSSLLNKIVGLNKKFKISNASLRITSVGEYLYPSLAFKLEPVSESVLEKYKVVFLDKYSNEIDSYEAPVTEDDISNTIEITCRNPVSNEDFVNAKLFINNEFIKEYSNK